MSRTDQAADAAQMLLMLGMGSLAGAASFTHVHDLAANHGQDGWIAWAVAVSIELLAVVAALEIRRTRRTGGSARMPFTVLLGGFGLSLAANVAEAQPTMWGWVTAATPAGAFLLVAKLAMRRFDTAGVTGLEPVPHLPVDQAAAVDCVVDAVVPELQPAPPVPAAPAGPGLAPALVEHARRVAAEHHAATGQPISLDALRVRLGLPAPLARTLHTAITTT